MNALLPKSKSDEKISAFQKIGSAILYGIVSIIVIFVNKIVLSTYHFPSFNLLALVQFLCTCSILLILKLFKRVEIPFLSIDIIYDILPVSMMFLGNVVFGLGSTKRLNLPMFTGLRRFSIMMTMIGEYLILHKPPSMKVMFSVFLMIGGALVAAYNDLTFDFNGYVMVFINNILTALNGVYLKKASLSTSCTKMGVLFYNSLFSMIALVVVLLVKELFQLASLNSNYSHYSINLETTQLPDLEDLAKVSIFERWRNSSEIYRVYVFAGWNDPVFQVTFFAAAIMGTCLNYAIFLCTTKNSALTTAVVGCLKNILVTYSGMLFPGYIFNWFNFLGLNISIVGSLYYTSTTMSS